MLRSSKTYFDSSTNNDVKYQRFVRGLRRDVKLCLNRRLIENPLNARAKSVTTRTRPTLIINPKAERKRLLTDIEIILNGPSLKEFYNRFLNDKDVRPMALVEYEESIVLNDD